jgi:predicted RNA-binding protein associated with RNAse of E/G family
MQEPIRRTSLGFDFLDHELDIVVSPDRDWRWKDRDHLEQAQIIGSLSPEQARAITQEAQQVVDDIARGVVPFDGSWNDWRPPSDWTIPSLPDGWDQVG